MTTDFLPAAVQMVEIGGADVEDALLPEEERALGRVSDRRRQEFAGGRACARRALAALGAPPAPIPIGPGREPVWPAGYVGSITHCAGLCAAAVARASDFVAIGLDAEPNHDLPEDLRDLVMSDVERLRLAALPASLVCWERLLFCAKESVYKAWFPLTRRWLDFADLEIGFLPDRARFRVSSCVPVTSADASFFAAEGRFRVTESHLVAFYGIAQQ